MCYFLFIFCVVLGTSFSAEISKNLSTSVSPRPTPSSHRDRSYLDPRVLISAPASCDLTVATCDINCCTDTDCNAHQKRSYKCYHDTRTNTVLNSWSCSSRPSVASPWFPLLCYITNNSPYLGEFFPRDTRKIQDLETFRKNLNKREYKFKTVENFPEIKSSNVYKLGSDIKAFEFNGKNEAKNINLPSGIVNSAACIFQSPVKYLEPQFSKCLHRISPEICKSGELSIDNYLINSDVEYGQWISIDGHRMIAANTTTQVYCYSQAASHLIKKFIMRSPLIHINPPIYIREYKKELCNDSRVYYEESTGLCHNVLVSLNYEFKWNGSNITELNSTYVLASVPVNSTTNNDLYLTRQFKVTFDHVKNDACNDSEDGEMLIRSGKPGYELGKPLIVGTLRWENDTSDNGSWEWEIGYAKLWRSGPDRECEGMRDLQFGYDATSTCYITLEQEDLANCSILRERMQEILNTLVQGEHVAKQGDLEFTDMQTVIPILRFDEDELQNVTGLPQNSTSVNVTLTARDVGTVDTNTRERNTCANIPTGLQFSILHSQHEFSRVPIHRLVGTAFTLTYHNLSRKTLRIPVTSSVTFIQVNIEDSMSRFWLKIWAPSEVAWHMMLTPFFEALRSGDAALELLFLWTLVFGAIVMSTLLWALGSR